MTYLKNSILILWLTSVGTFMWLEASTILISRLGETTTPSFHPEVPNWVAWVILGITFVPLILFPKETGLNDNKWNRFLRLLLYRNNREIKKLFKILSKRLHL